MRWKLRMLPPMSSRTRFPSKLKEILKFPLFASMVLLGSKPLNQTFLLTSLVWVCREFHEEEFGVKRF